MSNQESTPEAPAELREARDRAVERAAEAEARAAEAEAKYRNLSAQTAFKEVGLSEKHAELFLKANPEADITAEAVSDFAHEYSLVTQPAPENDEQPAREPAPNPDLGAAAFAGAAGSSTAGSAPPADAKMSQEDFQVLLATNPSAAAQAYQEGRVERNAQNVQAREMVQKGIIDH